MTNIENHSLVYLHLKKRCKCCCFMHGKRDKIIQVDLLIGACCVLGMGRYESSFDACVQQALIMKQ